MVPSDEAAETTEPEIVVRISVSRLAAGAVLAAGPVTTELDGTIVTTSAKALPDAAGEPRAAPRADAWMPETVAGWEMLDGVPGCEGPSEIVEGAVAACGALETDDGAGALGSLEDCALPEPPAASVRVAWAGATVAS